MNLDKLQDWLEDNGFDCELDTCDEFCYDETDDIIYVADAVPENSIKPFMRFAKSLGLRPNVNMNTVAFLHELGHSQTVPFLTSWEKLKDLIARRALNATQPKTELGCRVRYLIYHRLHKEKIATKWAIDFINANPGKAVELGRILTK